MLCFGWSASRVVFLDESAGEQHMSVGRGEEVCFVGVNNVLTADGDTTYVVRFPKGRAVAEYSVGPLSITVHGEPWPSYRWRPSVEPTPLNTVCSRLAGLRLRIGSPTNIFGQILLGLIEKAAAQLVDLGVNRWVEECAALCALSALGLTPIAPLLLDQEVEEIYLDRPGALCYLDHSKYGRLWFPYAVGKTTLLRLGLYTELSVGAGLSLSASTVKGYLQAGRLSLRLSFDAEPLAADGGSCVIRKLQHSKWKLDELIRCGTLTAELAALLVGAVRRGYSLLVAGLPRSGKTTLCNAILEYVPRDWRRLYIEDVLETRAPAADERVVRYSTESAFNTDKLLEVTKSLHRSPDLVFVGELQTKQQTLAAAMLMAVGIPCVQTVHATSLEGLLHRWRNIYNMKVDIRSPLLVVFMGTVAGQRRVLKVVLLRHTEEGGAETTVLFERGKLDWPQLSGGGLEEAYLEGVRAIGLAELPA